MIDYSKELKIQGTTSRASPAVYPFVNTQVLNTNVHYVKANGAGRRYVIMWKSP